mgnify:CR=1 FL=1
MDKQKIKVLYIDDEIQPFLDEYLLDIFGDENYSSFTFDSSTSLEELIMNDDIRKTNLIIIDSKLFVNSNSKGNKFTGEEIKTIFNKIFPFIETIIVSQNDDEENLGIIKKYQSSRQESIESFKDYYDAHLKPKINLSMENLKFNRLILEKLKDNESIEKALIDNLINCIDGIYDYDNLKKSDVDELISIFKEIEKKIC